MEAISNATAPLLAPLLPLLIVSQLALLVAVHVQPVGVVTAVDEEPAAPVAENDVGEMLYEHATAA